MASSDYDYSASSRGRLFKVLFLVAIAGLIGYFVYVRIFPAAVVPPQMPAAEVKVINVQAADRPLQFEYSGRSAGSREVEIRARVSGILLKRSYVEGQWVKKGQVLFTIDPAPFEAVRSQAEAKFKQAEADWNRVNALFKEKAVSAREFDEAKSNYEQSKGELRTAKINLDYTTVSAPITGVTSKEGFSEGSLVQADNSLLTRLTQLDPIYINFAYPDSEEASHRQMIDSGKLAVPEDKKLMAEIHFGDGKVYDKTGEISFTDSIIDPQTGTVSARAVLPNADGAILPGQFLRVVVKGFVAKNALAVPDKAILQGPQGAFVYVVSAEGKAEIRPVVLGMLDGDDRIVDSGLKNGDKVVTEGMIRVKPDALVTIAPDVDRATAPAAGGDAKASAPTGKKE